MSQPQTPLCQHGPARILELARLMNVYRSAVQHRLERTQAPTPAK